MTKIIQEETIFDAPVQFNLIPRREWVPFLAGDTTPSVRNFEFCVTKNTGAVTVTFFDDGTNTQELRIIGDGFTTIANNANIKTNTGAAKLLVANKIYRFSLYNRVWVEDA